MEDMQTGYIAALSMTLTAIIRNLSPDMAHRVSRDLKAALDVELEAEDGSPPSHAPDRNVALQAYLDLLAARASHA